MHSFLFFFLSNSLEGVFISSPHRFQTCTGYVYGCIPNRQYAFRVRGRNNLGWSEFSEESESAYAIDPIKAPSIGARFIDLVWPKPGGGGTVLEYELQMRKGASLDGAFTTVSATIGEQVYRVKDLEPLSPYSFRVRYKNSFGWSSWDKAALSQVMWTLAATPQCIDKPPKCIASTYSSLTLEWDLPPGNGEVVDLFEIRCHDGGRSSKYKDKGADPTSWFKIVSAHSTTCVCEGLMPDHAYVFQIRARNKCGWSGYSGSTSGYTTKPSAPPSTPRYVEHTAGISSFQIEWDPPPHGNKNGIFCKTSNINSCQLETVTF
jgi:hypothetical protein